MSPSRRSRLVSLVLLASFALRALPAWAVRSTHHCADHEHDAHSMAGMAMPDAGHTTFPVIADRTPIGEGCTHCPAAECEVAAACAGSTATSLPVRTCVQSADAMRSAIASAPVSGATHARPDLPTPPPRAHLSSR